MSTDWIKYKRFGWPDGSKGRALKELGCDSVWEAVEKAKQTPSAVQVKPKQMKKELTQQEVVEPKENEWVLFVNPMRQTFYVEELKE